MNQTTFEHLFESREWKPLRNCPGRFVLLGCRPDLPPEELIGNDSQVSLHRSAAAKDAVFVAVIEGGGLISYGRADGTFVHTLNTPEGFERKLLQLGIASGADSDAKNQQPPS